LALRCIIVLLIAVLPNVGVAASASNATIATQAQHLLDRAVMPNGPGVAMLIARGDTVIFQAARGSAQIELGVPLAADDVFRIASVTKMFTAATVLKLAELGKLAIDDTLAKYLPDFPDASRITLRELLNHTSGVSDVVKDPQPGFSRREVATDTLVAAIGTRPLDFPPGTRWAYSNAGYILLGAVIEKITAEPWHMALRRYVLDPVALEHTQFGAQGPLIPKRVAGYTSEPQSHAIRNAAYVSATIPAAAGALVSSADDLRVWLRALATGHVIGVDGLQQMVAPGPELPGTSSQHRYGFGLYLWRVRGNLMFGHTGQIDGFASFAGYLPKQQITVVALANDDTFDARSTGKRLAAVALGEPFAEMIAVPMSDELMEALAGTYRIDENTLEVLSIEGHRLFARRGNGNTIPLQMTANHQLHFVPDELGYFVPIRDAGGAIGRLDFFEEGEDPPRPLPRIADNVKR